MGVIVSVSEKARVFDPSGEHKKEIDHALKLLQAFRKKYPFKDDPASIDRLTPDDLFKKGEDYFFKWIEFKLRPLGRIVVGSTMAYLNACKQIDDFKELLRIAVDERKTLAEKIDAPWEKIGGMGGDKLIAKKLFLAMTIMYCPFLKHRT